MSKIKLAAGMAAKCPIKGNLTIKAVMPNHNYPIMVQAEDGQSFAYLPNGSYERDMQPTLKLLNIPFTQGLEVECEIYGKGVVIQIVNNGLYQVEVKFESGETVSYLPDGRFSEKANQTLYPQFTI